MNTPCPASENRKLDYMIHYLKEDVLTQKQAHDRRKAITGAKDQFEVPELADEYEKEARFLCSRHPELAEKYAVLISLIQTIRGGVSHVTN
jgi:hypothetical protein